MPKKYFTPWGNRMSQIQSNLLQCLLWLQTSYTGQAHVTCLHNLKMERELLWLAQCIRNHFTDRHQVTDRATHGKGKSIHKTGSPTVVLGQTSMPVTSQATQNPQHQPCLTPLSSYYATSTKQQMHLVRGSEELPTAVTTWDVQMMMCTHYK